MSTGRNKFGISIAHFFRQGRDELVEKQLVRTEFLTVTNRATNDSSQHVTAAFISRQYAINDQE